MAELTDSEKALAYYRAGVERVAPPFVPCRIRLRARVRGDLIFASTFAEPGDHDCTSNRWGAVSVLATDGKLLGVKPAEFEVLEWRPNPTGEG